MNGRDYTIKAAAPFDSDYFGIAEEPGLPIAAGRVLLQHYLNIKNKL